MRRVIKPVVSGRYERIKRPVDLGMEIKGSISWGKGG